MLKWKIIKIENILTLNQSIFGTKSRERRISKIALKASVKELYVPQESEEITYDDGYYIDGGAFLQIAGVAGAVVSAVCSSILYMNDLFNWGINWFWKIVLNASAFIGDVVSFLSGLGSLAKGALFNIASTILSKIGLGATAANTIAVGWKSYATIKHISGMFS